MKILNSKFQIPNSGTGQIPYLNRRSCIAGQAALTAVLFFLFISLAIIFGFTSLAIKETRISRINFDAKKSYFLSEAGQEDAIYRIVNAKQISGSETIIIDGETVNTNTVNINNDQKEISSSANFQDSIRSIKTVLFSSTPAFEYGGQVGDGGLEMDQNSQINGDVYSNGSVEGESGSAINGDATSAGTISAPPIISGAKTENAPAIPMPIPDTTINQWKSNAQAGGTISAGDYSPPDGSSYTIGPGVIEGDMILDNNQTVILAGTVWVKGNIDIDNGSEMTLLSSYGQKSEVLITDGWIHIRNNGNFQGSGTTGSYLMMITTSACQGDGAGECTHHDAAVDLHNNAEGTIFYAPNGFVNLHNNVIVNQLTAWGIVLDNNAAINYEIELANIAISSDKWQIQSWQEIE